MIELLERIEAKKKETEDLTEELLRQISNDYEELSKLEGTLINNNDVSNLLESKEAIFEFKTAIKKKEALKRDIQNDYKDFVEEHKDALLNAVPKYIDEKYYNKLQREYKVELNKVIKKFLTEIDKVEEKYEALFIELNKELNKEQKRVLNLIPKKVIEEDLKYQNAVSVLTYDIFKPNILPINFYSVVKSGIKE